MVGFTLIQNHKAVVLASNVLVQIPPPTGLDYSEMHT